MLLQSKFGGIDRTHDIPSNFDLSTLPPSTDTLQEHLHRVSYQVAIWKRAHIAKPDIPHPTDGHGWTYGDNDVIIPKWTSGDIMPVQLVDVLEGLEGESGSECENSDDYDDAEEMLIDSSSSDESDDDL